MTDKFYYRITRKEDEEILFAAVGLPIKAEKLCEFIGLGDGFAAEQISKEEYEAGVDEE